MGVERKDGSGYYFRIFNQFHVMMPTESCTRAESIVQNMMAGGRGGGCGWVECGATKIGNEGEAQLEWGLCNTKRAATVCLKGGWMVVIFILVVMGFANRERERESLPMAAASPENKHRLWEQWDTASSPAHSPLSCLSIYPPHDLPSTGLSLSVFNKLPFSLLLTVFFAIEDIWTRIKPSTS